MLTLQVSYFKKKYKVCAKLLGFLMIVTFLLACVVGQGAKENVPVKITQQSQTEETVLIPQEALNREFSIPKSAIKASPKGDLAPPIMHSSEWSDPVPLPGSVNTAGAEDAPFVLPDGKSMYFFFTPDLSVPHEKQILDGVTGIYVAIQQNGSWENIQRVVLQTPGKIALDGCPFVLNNTLWFCSAREGYSGIHWFTVQTTEDDISGLRIADGKFGPGYEVGELHITSDQNELYFHSSRPGGKGEFDIWVTKREDGMWQPPENVEEVNSEVMEGWPFVSQDHRELWITRTYQGSPAIYRSLWDGDAWLEPELIVSQFAGEPTLDNKGNLYFTHHFQVEGKLQEADIYVAYRR